jgi:hypothetical protein
MNTRSFVSARRAHLRVWLAMFLSLLFALGAPVSAFAQDSASPQTSAPTDAPQAAPATESVVIADASAKAEATPAPAAAPTPVANKGDTAWILVCSALVIFMTLPGLALFYGGLVRSKNVLSVLMQCLVVFSARWRPPSPKACICLSWRSSCSKARSLASPAR